MTEYFLGTGRLIIGTIKMPRSKKKRIRNKWIKKQSQLVTDFKITVDKEELESKAVKPLKPLTHWNFTLDDISEEAIGYFLPEHLIQKYGSKFMDAVNTPSSEDTHILDLYKGETK